VPFYVALPCSTIDWNLRDPHKEIPIESRSADEVRYAQGLVEGEIRHVLLTPESAPVRNVAFDVTPPRLITGIITERGIVEPNEEAVYALFPEQGNSRGLPSPSETGR